MTLRSKNGGVRNLVTGVLLIFKTAIAKMVDVAQNIIFIMQLISKLRGIFFCLFAVSEWITVTAA